MEPSEESKDEWVDVEEDSQMIAKQNFLREQIIDAGYDKHQFAEYMSAL